MKNRINLLHTVVCALSLTVVSIIGTSAASLPTTISNEDAKLKIFSAYTKGEIVDRMKRQKWAGDVLDHAHKQVDKYVDIHQTDTLWILSRLQMYWKNHYTTPYINGAHYSRAEGSAPVPTVRFTGGRDWASDYSVPSLEQTIPYMDYRDDEIYLQNSKKEGKPWEWVPSSQTAHQIEHINSRIVEKAMYASFIYWLSGDEKYAKFAYDILMTYMQGIYYREAPISEIDHRNKSVVGLTSFEVIHERVLDYLPICYDLLYGYIEKQNTDLTMPHAVLQKFADQIIVNGVANNNWNVFQACFVTYLALILDDDDTYENGKGQQYYIDFILNKSVERQRAIREVCNTYDQNTAMWNEAAGYSMATTKDLMEILWLIDGIDNKNILKDFSIVERAVIASFEYLLPNMKSLAFGDNQYSSVEFPMCESLLAMYQKYGDTESSQLLMSILNQQIETGAYDRTRGISLYKLFNYVEEIDPNAKSTQTLFSTTFYSPNINIAIQRNGMDRAEGLMAANVGTGFNHCHANGINLELYGKGYPLGVDKARGSSYWRPDHSQYYSKPISHNTVIIDGKSSNTSDRQNPSEDSKVHKMLSVFPETNQRDSDTPYAISYFDNQYFERSTKSNQRRLTGIVRTSPTSGYYVDIFRSGKVDGGEQMHEYLYHNAGQSFTLYDAKGQSAVAMSPSTDLTSEGGKAKGYDYLTDKMEVAYEDNFVGRFELNFDDSRDDVRMDVWMKGGKGRKIFSAMTPPALKGLGGDMTPAIESAKIPAMVVRQSGEAWKRPFVAIYEPYTAQGGKSVESVEYIDSNSSDFVGICVESKGDIKEYILNSTECSQVTLKGIDVAFEAIYGVISQRSGKISYMFMGSGSQLSCGKYSISSDRSDATVLVEWCDAGIKVKSNAAATLRMPASKGISKTLSYVDSNGTSHSISGSIKRGVIEYPLPPLDSVVLR